jgi:REP-associated tyrosine transposase
MAEGSRGNHGGRRPGAGRKPLPPGEHKGHRSRPSIPSATPVLVTLHLVGGAPRVPAVQLRRCVALANEHPRFRVSLAASQPDRVDLICEAADRVALARGIQGLAIRISRAVNRELGRKGRLFGRRYDARVLLTPTELREARAAVGG